MDLQSLIIFAGALLVAAGSPGPSLAALVARVLSNGWRDVLPFVAAMWLGEAIWLSMTLGGLAVLAETFHLAFRLLKYAGIAYLLYLAWGMWTAPTQFVRTLDSRPGGRAWSMFFAGFAVTLGNPKIMIFYLALLPTFIDMSSVTGVDWTKLIVIMLGVLAAIDLSYIVLASRARLLMTSPKAMRISNRASASVMAGAAGWIGFNS